MSDSRRWSSWFVVRRQRRALSLPVAAPSAPQAVQAARTPRPHDELRVRVHATGRIRCRARRRGRDSVPYFVGQLRDTGHGVELAGTIHESRQPGVFTVTYTGMTLFMGAIAVLCALARPVVIPGLAVCAPATIAFGALAVLIRRQRLTVFPLYADILTRLIRERFGA